MNVNQFKKKFTRGLAYKPLFYLPVEDEVNKTPVIIRFELPDYFSNEVIFQNANIKGTIKIKFGFNARNSYDNSYTNYTRKEKINGASDLFRETEFNHNLQYDKNNPSYYNKGAYYGKGCMVPAINPKLIYWFNDDEENKVEINSEYTETPHYYNTISSIYPNNILYEASPTYTNEIIINITKDKFINRECYVKLYITRAEYLHIDVNNLNSEIISFGNGNSFYTFQYETNAILSPLIPQIEKIPDISPNSNTQLAYRINSHYGDEYINFRLYDYTDWDNLNLYNNNTVRKIQEIIIGNQGTIVIHPIENLKFNTDLFPNLHKVCIVDFPKIYNPYSRFNEMCHFKNGIVSALFEDNIEIHQVCLLFGLTCYYDIAQYGIEAPNIIYSDNLFKNCTFLETVILNDSVEIITEYYKNSLDNLTLSIYEKNQTCWYGTSNNYFKHYYRKKIEIGSYLFSGSYITNIIFNYKYDYSNAINAFSNSVWYYYLLFDVFLNNYIYKNGEYVKSSLIDMLATVNRSSGKQWNTFGFEAKDYSDITDFEDVFASYNKNWFENCPYIYLCYGEFYGDCPSDYLLDIIKQSKRINTIPLFVVGFYYPNITIPIEYLNKYPNYNNNHISVPFGISFINKVEGEYVEEVGKWRNIYYIISPTINNPEVLNSLTISQMFGIWYTTATIDDVYGQYYAEDANRIIIIPTPTSEPIIRQFHKYKITSTNSNIGNFYAFNENTPFTKLTLR